MSNTNIERWDYDVGGMEGAVDGHYISFTDHAEVVDGLNQIILNSAAGFAELTADINAARAEIAELKKDAARWRHARKLLAADDIEFRQNMLVESDFLVSERYCKKADNAIDVAMENTNV